jgi:hypothetical protein
LMQVNCDQERAPGRDLIVAVGRLVAADHAEAPERDVGEVCNRTDHCARSVEDPSVVVVSHRAVAPVQHLSGAIQLVRAVERERERERERTMCPMAAIRDACTGGKKERGMGTL